MAKTADKYPITFGYGAKTTIGGKVYVHRGEDRRCPVGTPIKIGSKVIGKTGNTGLSTGPHLHLQVGTDPAAQKTIKPTQYWFKPGRVVGIRKTNTGQWGKFVKLKVGAKYVVYAHLSEVNVKSGELITLPKPKKVYTIIRKGEGLSSIARRSGYKLWFLPTAWQKITELNGHKKWRIYNAGLQAGRKIRVR